VRDRIDPLGEAAHDHRAMFHEILHEPLRSADPLRGRVAGTNDRHPRMALEEGGVARRPERVRSEFQLHRI
jgi:hypothetical protein